MAEMSLATLKDEMPVPEHGPSLASLGFIPPPRLPGRDISDAVAGVLHGAFVQPIKDAYRAVTGKMTDEEQRQFAFEAALGVVPGARLAKAAGRALPMDAASRMARAPALGFRMNELLAHGTASDFRAFDPAKGGVVTGAAPARLGVWSEMIQPGEEAAIAEYFAANAARRSGGDPRLMPLVHRAEKRGVISLSGNEADHEIAATLAQAWDDGFDATKLENYTRHGGKPGTVLVVKDPAQLRSPFAAFNPKRVKSRNLLAGMALGTAGAPLALDAGAEQ